MALLTRASAQDAGTGAGADAGAPAAREQAVEVMVVAPRRKEERLRDSPIAVSVVDRAQIETSGARDAADALATQPGLQIDASFAGAGVQLQGLDPQHALILVDGERLVGARDGVLDLSRFYASDIEQIEIVRGPASAAYGSDAMAGVINIVTRPPGSKLAMGAQGRYGLTRGTPRITHDYAQHGDTWATVVGGTPRLRTRASGGYRRTGAFDLDPSTPATTGARFDAYSAQGRLDWLAAPGLRVPLNVRVARRNARAVDESALGAVYDRTQRSDDLAVNLTPRVRLRGGGSLQLSASYAVQRAQYRRDQRRDDDGDSYEDAREQVGTLRAQADVPLPRDVTLTSGVELLGQHYTAPRLLEPGKRGRVSPYVELSWLVRKECKCSITPSARLDWDSQFGVNVSPRLSLRADPVEALTLRGSLGRGFRAPNFSELLLNFSNTAVGYRVTGNRDLKPERSLGANFSAEWRFVESASATVSLFRNELRDLIDTGLVEVVAGEQLFSYVNRRRARTQGVEAWLDVNLTSLLLVQGSYTLTDTRDLALKHALPGRARHRGSARVLVGGGARPWAVSARCQLVGKRRYYNEGQGASGTEVAFSVPAYASIDARVAYRVHRTTELFASGENLADVRPRNTPLRPTTVYVGLNLVY
ncbi:MAG: TonB-dependent receptor [Polyangiales bacterium]